MTEPSREELMARIAELEEKQGSKRGGKLEFRIGDKGGVSVYGLGRFPVTLYYEQWIKLRRRRGGSAGLSRIEQEPLEAPPASRGLVTLSFDNDEGVGGRLAVPFEHGRWPAKVGLHVAQNGFPLARERRIHSCPKQEI